MLALVINQAAIRRLIATLAKSRIFRVLAVGIALVAVGTYAWHEACPTFTFNCRVTLYVNDHNQIRTGSSVFQLSYTVYPEEFVFGAFPNRYPDINGYAPFVDLGPRGQLFMSFQDTLSRQGRMFCLFADSLCLVFAAYFEGDKQIGINPPLARVEFAELLSQHGPRIVTISNLPQLVWLRGPEDTNGLPVSADELNALGLDVSLDRVVVEITDHPLSPRPADWPKQLLSVSPYSKFGGIR